MTIVYSHILVLGIKISLRENLIRMNSGWFLEPVERKSAMQAEGLIARLLA
jgi:hypothetical protein